MNHILFLNHSKPQFFIHNRNRKCCRDSFLESSSRQLTAEFVIFESNLVVIRPMPSLASELASLLCPSALRCTIPVISLASYVFCISPFKIQLLAQLLGVLIEAIKIPCNNPRFLQHPFKVKFSSQSLSSNQRI